MQRSGVATPAADSLRTRGLPVSQMLIRANTLLPICSPAVRAGAVRVEDGRITAVGEAGELSPLAGEEVVELGDAVLLPGLINAHCHLDYSTLRNAIAPQAGFTEWVQRLNSIKRQLSPEDILDAIARGYAEAQQFGTTTVCSMAAFPDLLPRLGRAPLRTWWFYEMIDIRHRITSEELVAGALSFFEQNPDPLVRYGLNPHAPYTASLLLYRLARACAEHSGMVLTTHVAESQEESDMFTQARGALYEFLSGLGRPMHDCGHDTPFGWLWRNGAVCGRWLLAHLNDLAESDFALLATLSPEQLPSVVHCPGSHRYFRHPPFPFERLAALGVNLCVATDSLASTDSLALLGELRRVAEAHAGLTPEDLLRTVTLAPARALGQQGLLGCIAPGAFADLIAIPFAGTPAEAAAACVAHPGRVPWMMLDGKIISP
jgi:cytosine/adenosine deaminase-related metal-dependent hydrolase